MDYLTLFFTSLTQLSQAMAPYILFGLLFAGLLHEGLPQSFITRHLGSENISSVIKATLFGVPLPVCSCGVIPLAASIKKSGASKGATLSFLISTPITGVDSILATYGMFGWAFTFYRIFTSMIIAAVAGILTNIYDKDVVTKPAFSFSPQKPPAQEQSSCCSGSSCCSSQTKSKRFSLKKALKYGFITLLGDIAKPLFWGLIIGALITALLPENLSNLFSQHVWLSYIVAVAVAVPMYVCATASLPIAAAMMLSGVSAGAAFVFLSAGPATNTVTIGVVKDMLGKRALTLYLVSIVVGSIVFGIGLDLLFDTLNIDAKNILHLHEEFSIVSAVSAVMLWSFILYFLLKKKLFSILKA